LLYLEQDWDSIYCEVNRVLSGDPRFSYWNFYNRTPVDQIYSVLKSIRELENERLHRESIALSLLTASFVAANSSRESSEKIKAEDYQPFKKLVDLDKDIKYPPNLASTLIGCQKSGILPAFVGNAIDYEAVKDQADEYERVGFFLSCSSLVIIHPRVKGGKLLGRLVITDDIQSPNLSLLVTHEAYPVTDTPCLTIAVNRSESYQILQDAEFDIISVYDSDLWHYYDLLSR
jgi:hypothetical protein